MEILRLSDENLEEVASQAAAVLARGGVVVFPTDTLYGIAVDALNEDAIARLKRVKSRQTKKPISVIVPDTDTLHKHVTLGEEGARLAATHLPGALTIVVPAAAHIPDELTLNGMLGVRIPNDPFALTLARLFGRPYTATSANKTGYQTPHTVEDILVQLGPELEHIDLVIDAGPRDSRHPSTVVAIREDGAHILREGAISRDELGL